MTVMGVIFVIIVASVIALAVISNEQDEINEIITNPDKAFEDYDL